MPFLSPIFLGSTTVVPDSIKHQVLFFLLLVFLLLVVQSVRRTYRVTMLFTALIAAVLALRVYADDSSKYGVQGEWSSPKAPDFTSTYYRGNTYTIAWSSNLSTSFSKYCAACDPENAQLWVMGADNSNPSLVACKSSDELRYMRLTDMGIKTSTLLRP